MDRVAARRGCRRALDLRKASSRLAAGTTEGLTQALAGCGRRRRNQVFHSRFSQTTSSGEALKIEE